MAVSLCATVQNFKVKYCSGIWLAILQPRQPKQTRARHNIASLEVLQEIWFQYFKSFSFPLFPLVINSMCHNKLAQMCAFPSIPPIGRIIPVPPAQHHFSCLSQAIYFSHTSTPSWAAYLRSILCSVPRSLQLVGKSSGENWHRWARWCSGWGWLLHRVRLGLGNQDPWSDKV